MILLECVLILWLFVGCKGIDDMPVFVLFFDSHEICEYVISVRLAG